MNILVHLQTLYSWFHCGAEVFRIFAVGKPSGTPINDGDTVVFYFPVFQSFVNFQPNVVTSDKCIRGNPANPDASDGCFRSLVVSVK